MPGIRSKNCEKRSARIFESTVFLPDVRVDISGRPVYICVGVGCVFVVEVHGALPVPEDFLEEVCYGVKRRNLRGGGI